MQTEQIKALVVGTAVAFVCSVLVSTAVVMLKPFQDANKTSERVILISAVSGLDGEPQEVYSGLKPMVVNLDTGDYKPAENPNYWTDNFKNIVKNTATGEQLSPSEDKASIKIVPDDIMVYMSYVDGKPKTVLLPVYGMGLYSMLYAYISVNVEDLTIVGIKFYEQGETPGLGGEVENPKWQSQWSGKKIYDSDYDVRFAALKRRPEAGSESASYTVDALTGASLTTRGINGMMQFWFGDKGYKTFLMKLQEEA